MSADPFLRLQGLCGQPVAEGFIPSHCIRPLGHPGEHLDFNPHCAACDRLILADTLYGPAMPCHLDGGSAHLHRRCRDLLAAERAGETAA